MNKIINVKNKEKTQARFRRLYTIYGQNSVLLCIPIEFTYYLGLSKGDYVKCRINDNKQLIVEKAFDNSDSVRNNKNSAVMGAEI